MSNDLKGWDSPPSDFRLPADLKKHAITFLTLDGDEVLSTQENLFEVVKRFVRRFVVDNNISWLKLAKMPDNVNTAFVLGTTVDHESSPPRFLLEDNCRKPKICHNFFQFGMKTEETPSGDPFRYLIISRLDAHATAILDMNALRKFDQPCGGNTKWNRTKSIAEEKEKVLALLSVKRLEELKHLLDRRAKDGELRLCIEGKIPECINRFWGSDEVARLAFARLLLGQDHISSEARKEFGDRNYANVFGDVHLIQNALFFNAGVASNDRAVKRMARFCGLPVLTTNQRQSLLSPIH